MAEGTTDSLFADFGVYGEVHTADIPNGWPRAITARRGNTVVIMVDRYLCPAARRQVVATELRALAS
jgi:hypothetical protein